jgi:flagellar motor switch protein FliM
MATESDPVDIAEEGINQNEIDNLFGDVSSEELGTIIKCDGTRFKNPKGIGVQKYDFTNPVIFSEVDLQKVKSRAEHFAHYLGGHLSMFLRKELTLQLTKFESNSYKNFTRDIGEPACVRLFKMQEINGVCILNISPKLAVSIVEILLGGQGLSTTDERDLTDIEKALIDDAVNIIIEEYCRQWEDILHVTPKIIGRESSGRFLQTSPKDALMLTISMEATFGDVSGTILLGIPYYTINPIVQRLAEKDTDKKIDIDDNPRVSTWHSSYDNIDVPVSAEWDTFQLSVKELLSLRAGDIIELPNELISNVMLRVEGKICFEGEVGVEGDRTAVRITKTRME